MSPLRRSRRVGFVERTLVGLLDAIDYAAAADETASRRGFLQSLDPRAKIVGLLALVVATAVSRRLDVVLALFAVAVGIALASRVSIATLARRVWFPALLFTGAIALPAIVLTPGAPAVRLPFGVAATEQGLRAASVLVSRVVTATTFSTLIVLTTKWSRVLKALRVLGVPVVVVVVLGMTYRYIFVMLQTARDMFEAHRSRALAPLGWAGKRRLATSSAGVLLAKSIHLSGEIYLAMQSRGFRGETYTLDDFSTRARDWAALAAFAAVAGWAVYVGATGGGGAI